jgi:conjugative relaxase-like TrwC/TraI family protein
VAWLRIMGLDSVEYHRATVLGGADDHPGQAVLYYGGRGETPLVWGGRLADRLGLVGAVDDDGYDAIYGRGGPRDPHLGTRLAATKRPGVELVVAAHKTVAVLGLIGQVEDMHAILDAETDATLAFLDQWFVRQGGRRGKSQRRTHTSGLLWARTRHLTSRAGDPAPHDHVLIANLTEMLDDRGGWKALDTAGIRDLVHAATMAGRLVAAEKAVCLGYAIEPDHGPSGKLDHWRIAGIPHEVADHFSKRSEAIQEELEQKGFRSYRARGVAARNSRDAKTHEEPEALVVRWLDELHEIGWPTRKLNRRLDQVNQAHHQPLRTLTDRERAQLAQDVIGTGGPLAKRKAFTRADVVRVAAPLLYGCASDELDRVVEGVVRHREAIALVGQPGARGRAWAAASVLAKEQAVEAVAERLATRDDAARVGRLIAAAMVQQKQAALGRSLTRSQQAAIARVFASGRGLDLIVGVAGSGKTTALEVLRAGYEDQGYRVLGTAISGQAARTLRTEAAVDSRTIASLVWRLEHQELALDARTVLLIDEAGMADDQALLKLLAAVDVAGAKAIVVGDHHQLDAVEPGGGVEALINRHGPAVHVLDENIRQRDPAERTALEHLRSGKVAVAVEWYRDNDRLRTGPTRDDALDAAIAAWDADLRAGRDAVVLAWRRRDVAALNERARARRSAAGAITGPEIEAPGGRRYAVGDRVVTLAPSGDGRFVTSERGSVAEVGPNQLTVRFDDGRTALLAGDELGTDRLDHAYAVTVHRMQGATVDRAHVFADGGGRELAYVAMSRARDTSHVYVAADDLDQAVEDLTVEWSADRRQRWVLDTDEPCAGEKARRPSLEQRTETTLHLARLRAERDAVAAIALDAEQRLRSLDLQVRLTRVEDEPPGRERGRAEGRARWFLLAPAAGVVALALIVADVPLKARWTLSRSDFAAVVDEALEGGLRIHRGPAHRSLQRHARLPAE